MVSALKRYKKPGGMIVSADFSREMLAKSRSRNPDPGCFFVLSDAKRMPFPDSTFDLVTISFATRQHRFQPGKTPFLPARISQAAEAGRPLCQRGNQPAFFGPVETLVPSVYPPFCSTDWFSYLRFPLGLCLPGPHDTAFLRRRRTLLDSP